MRVVITGAAGFLGRAFMRHHVAAGDTIVAVDNFSADGSYWPKGVYVRRRMDAGEWFAEDNGWFDRAYHFAAPVGGRLRIEGDPLYNADSLRLDSLFFRWAASKKVGTAIYPSSSAVYGTIFQDGLDPLPLMERQFRPTEPFWPAPDEMYGFTKMAGEVLAVHAAKYGLNTLCIRPFSGYGEEQSLDYPMPSICQRALNCENPLVVWGSGHQTRDFIHVDDIVGATQALLAEGVSGYRAVNLGSGLATSFVEVATLAASYVGYGPTITTDESKPEGVASRYSDPATMLAVYEPRVGLGQGIARVIDHLAQRRP